MKSSKQVRERWEGRIDALLNNLMNHSAEGDSKLVEQDKFVIKKTIAALLDSVREEYKGMIEKALGKKDHESDGWDAFFNKEYTPCCPGDDWANIRNQFRKEILSKL